MNKILYVIGGRSFLSADPGRKISEVISVWKRLGIYVYTCFGKDLINANASVDYGNQAHFDSNIRRKKYLQFLVHTVSELRDIIHDRKVYRSIKKEHLNNKLDLIWERSSRLHWAGLRLAKKKNIPFVLEWKDHLVDYNLSLFKVFANYIENYKIKHADYIVVESNVLKEELINQGAERRKIRVALNAVDPSEFTRDKEKGIRFKIENGIPNENIVVGYLGSYAFYHDTEILVHAAKNVLESNANTSFLMVGNGKDHLKCKELAVKLGILGKGLIMLNGVKKEKVPEILSAMDITVLPGSTDIICPIKIMENMAAETAVLAPDYPCNREIITNENGVLFLPHSINDLSSKIELLISNSELRLRLSENSRKYVQNNLTWEQTWGKVLVNILENEKNYT